MSITRVYSVFCDVMGDRCHGWIAETLEGAAAARREARRAGWKRQDGQDVCPGCLLGDPHPGARIMAREPRPS